MSRPQFLDLMDRTGMWYGPPPEVAMSKEIKQMEQDPMMLKPQGMGMGMGSSVDGVAQAKAAEAQPLAGKNEEAKAADMKPCSRCRKQLTADSLFCAFCGHKCGVKECARCKSELTADSLFCGTCGQRCDAVPFPDAHQLYDYGIRSVYFSRVVPVPEWNHGVMINEEHILQPDQEGVLYNRNDDAIRNRGWYYTGSFLPRAEDMDETVDQYLHHHADWKKAFDITGVTRIPVAQGQKPKRPQGYKREPKAEEFHDVLERKTFTSVDQLQEHLAQREMAQYRALKYNGRL
jgi:hypothetical protein